MKRITRFLWWCAGARIEILEECPSDHAKYFGIGGTILFTALMAAFAGAYAFYTAFRSIPLSIFFGIFWGLLIFNLDRYIVATIKDDGKASISASEWLSALPRLLMAVLLGFVIATPLELRIFETEIQTVVERLKIDKAEELKSRDVSFNNQFDELKERRSKVENDLAELTNNKKTLIENAGAYYQERKGELQLDASQKQKELDAVQAQVNRLHSNYNIAKRDSLPAEKIAKAKQNRDYQIGIRNKIRNEKTAIDDRIELLSENRGEAIRQEQIKIDKQISQLLSEKESNQDKITQMGETRDAKRVSYDNKVENYDGFAAHLEAMSILTDEKPVIFWAKWLITLLLIFIEIAPVLFKMMNEAGDYDKIIARQRHFVDVQQMQLISNLNDQINTDIEVSSSKNKGRLDAELQGNKKLIESIALAQADIAKKAVQKWKDQEMSKLDHSVSHIIKSNMPQDYKFEDQFWVHTNKGIKSVYCFRDGNTHEVWVQQGTEFKLGKWKKAMPDLLEIDLDSVTTYKMLPVSDKKMILSDTQGNSSIELIKT